MSDAAHAEDHSAEIEARAREMGWRPKDEWEGDDSGWMEAESFIERQDKRRAVANEEFKEENERLRAELATVKTAQAEDRKTLEEFQGWRDKAEERIYKKALKDLQSQQRAAVESGDTAAFDNASKEIDELVEDARKPAEQKQKSPDEIPAYKAWHAKNAWYNTDLRLTKEANALAPEIARIYGLTPEQPEFYEKITEQLKEDFPDKFKNPRRDAPSTVEAGSGGPPRKPDGKKTYADLPAEAKAACDKFVKQKLMTRDEYVKDYFEEE